MFQGAILIKNVALMLLFLQIYAEGKGHSWRFSGSILLLKYGQGSQTIALPQVRNSAGRFSKLHLCV